MIPSPWKYYAAAAGILAIFLAAAGTYLYVDNLQRRLVRTSAQLVEEQIRRAQVEETVRTLYQERDEAVERLEHLERENARSDAEWLAPMDQIYSLEPETADDNSAAEFNRLNADLNRMLERQTR